MVEIITTSRLSLRAETDVLIIRHGSGIRAQQDLAGNLAEAIGRVTGFKLVVILAPHDWDISLVDEDFMRKYGWVRDPDREPG